ncbi:MAG: hypothetical protein JSW27_07090, partial [Phycisphaerales bacterium]
GDLNTMGLNAAFNKKSDLAGDEEIASLTKRMKSVKLTALQKSHEASWWNGKDNWAPSKLDHVFAAEHLKFKDFGGYQVKMVGWPDRSTKAQQRSWIDNYSDHALLYAEIVN